MAWSGSLPPVSPLAATPSSSRFSTVARPTCSALSIASSASESQKRTAFSCRAGATTITSVWFGAAPSPTAERSCRDEMGSLVTTSSFTRCFLPEAFWSYSQWVDRWPNRHVERSDHGHIGDRRSHRHEGQGLQHHLVHGAVPLERVEARELRPGRRAGRRFRARGLLPPRAGREPQGSPAGQGAPPQAAGELARSCTRGRLVAGGAAAAGRG